MLSDSLDYFMHVQVHGLLHLLGFDHEISEEGWSGDGGGRGDSFGESWVERKRTDSECI